jgi:coproporphyrinogen III oxidase-like Fe-S oxidoreductase
MMIERILPRYVFRKSGEALGDMEKSAAPPTPPSGGVPLQGYLHIPFCEDLCGYCTFNRQRFEKALARRYSAALRAEITLYHERGFTFDRFYIGGGTPTVLPEELRRTVALLRSLWRPVVTSVETHPDHLGEPVVALLEEAGVNRLSVGVQSFQAEVLSGLGRKRSRVDSDETCRRLARSIARFKTVNVDMIFGVPGQSAAMLRKDILAIREVLPHQVTFYPLMGEESRPDMPSWELYAQIAEGLSDLYQFSSGWSFSRKGTGILDEYIAEREDYVGMGSGSFGYVDGAFYANTFLVQEYIQHIEQGRLPVVVRKRFSRPQRLRYHLLMRLFGGRIDPAEVLGTFGFFPVLQLWRELLMMAGARGIWQEGRPFVLTERGRFLSMLMMKAFMSAVSRFRKYCRTVSNA